MLFPDNQNKNQVGCWLWKLIWKVNALQSMLLCFVQLLVKKSILTQENLSRRVYQLCSRCYLCGSKQRQSTISFYTTNGLTNCGKFCSTSGASDGLCQRLYLQSDRIGKTKRNGGLSQLASGGQYGKKEIRDALKIKEAPSRSLK